MPWSFVRVERPFVNIVLVSRFWDFAHCTFKISPQQCRVVVTLPGNGGKRKPSVCFTDQVEMVHPCPSFHPNTRRRLLHPVQGPVAVQVEAIEIPLVA